MKLSWHWRDLCEQDGITLQQMLDVGILDHIDTLERISVKAPGLCFDGFWRPRNNEIFCFVVLVLQAQKEYGLKTALAMMKKEPKPRNQEQFVKHLWKSRSRNVDSRRDAAAERILSPLSPCFRWRPIEFGLVPHRSGTYMVKGIDEIQAKPQWRSIACFLTPHQTGQSIASICSLVYQTSMKAVLDDHIIKTMGIRGSPFVRSLRHDWCIIISLFFWAKLR